MLNFAKVDRMYLVQEFFYRLTIAHFVEREVERECLEGWRGMVRGRRC
jgi:hypothetical protein